MQKKQSITPEQLSEIISQIEYKIFNAAFYAKYGYFFDHLINMHITPKMEYPDEFNRMVSGIALFWDDVEKLHILYSSTPCDLLYALYVRVKTLTVHAHSLRGCIEIPDGTAAAQFKFLMTIYYNSDVHTPLSEVHGASLL